MRSRTILSMEQALSLPSATLRFAQLGWRVIRIEAVGRGRGLPGDPNRYIGERVVDDDRRSYFIAPNVGKEAIALDLKSAEGQEVLKRLIQALDVDVFCCNTLPGRYQALGIDYETLSAVKPKLIWAAISALGPDYPMTPGYDPALQAMAGFMELTGMPGQPPTLSGVPLVDLKAGDDLYAAVCLALAEQAETGRGRRIDVSMLQAAASWLITTLPLLDFNCRPDEITRCGNEHRKFIPTNAYPTKDGFIFVAIGSDEQWRRLTLVPGFESLARPARENNQGRHDERRAIHQEMAAVTATLDTAALAERFAKATIPHAPIHDIPQVREMAALHGRLTTTHTPDGRRVRMQPMAVDWPAARRELAFAPRYGEHTGAVLREAGYDDAQLEALHAAGVIAAARPAASSDDAQATRGGGLGSH